MMTQMDELGEEFVKIPKASRNQLLALFERVVNERIMFLQQVSVDFEMKIGGRFAACEELAIRRNETMRWETLLKELRTLS